MSPEELQYYYSLYLCDGIGAQRLIGLRTYFGSAERAFSASARQLESVPGLGKSSVQDCVNSRADAYAKAKKQLSKLPADVAVITFFDEAYPASLRDIFGPPALLFLRGNPDLLRSERNLAVIGTRRITDYGKRVTAELCKTFAEHGVTVTSGFALGVDTAAHRAIFANGGSTIAVLGSGIDVIYPPSNASFAEEIVASGRGLIVSDLPIGTKPDGKNFPWRNRIVCGLTSATVVIESDEKGGSMITASIAVDQGREVFALPGDVNRPMSSGPNILLTEHKARPFRNADDILKAMEWIDVNGAAITTTKRIVDTSALKPVEETIYNILNDAGEPMHIDLIVERSGLEVQVALVHLFDLELNDYIRQLPGKHFSTIF